MAQEIRAFNPEQEEEAMNWVKTTLPKFYEFVESLPPHNIPGVLNIKESVLDMYFKLKNITFDLRPNQFVVGIEYKDSNAVIAGTEKVNVSFFNPHKNDTKDDFAYQVLLHILNSSIK